MSNNIADSWIGCIVASLSDLKPEARELLNYVCDLISEIREPVIKVEHSLDDDEKRSIDLKVCDNIWFFNCLDNNRKRFLCVGMGKSFEEKNSYL